MSDVLALFPGTFDPVTYGHLDVARRAAGLFDRLVVAVADGAGGTHFSAAERVALLEPLLADLDRVRVEAFRGLLADFARARGARVLVRGVRGVRDLETEQELAYANRTLAPGLESVFLVPSPGVALVSSSLVREVAAHRGDVSAWVPPSVAAALEARPPVPPSKSARKED